MNDKYFVYDPENGFETYATQEQAESEADELIQAYLQDGWGEGVDNVVSGIITHVATQTNRKERPDNLDEEGCDEEGLYWDDFDFQCDYQLLPTKTA